MDECDETFLVQLTNLVNGVLVDGEGIGTIVSDDLLGCTNADGDCFHDPACGGLDCDDLDPLTYPRAPESNETLDNQCPGDPGYGVIDEVSGVSGFLSTDLDEFSWPDQAFATFYEVARSSRADFTADCTMLAATANTFVIDPVVLQPGDVVFYLVRASLPNQGSWGQASDGSERLFACPAP